jgi:integrase
MTEQIALQKQKQTEQQSAHVPLAPGKCETCGKRNAFCSCNSTLPDDPIRSWADNSSSPKSFEWRKNILEKFCYFTQKTLYQLLEIAASHKPGELQLELQSELSRYLEWRVTPKPKKPGDPDGCGIAPSTTAKDGGAISGFFASRGLKVKVPKKFRGVGATYETDRTLTQQEVHQMIECSKSLLETLVICLISQLGQRIGLLRALTYNMIKPMLEDPRWGYVELKGDYFDHQGKPVGRKISVHYCFLVHPESMSLIEKMRIEQGGKSDYILTIPVREMQRIFDNCAKRAGLQKKEKHLENKNELHAHMQRGFFEIQMIEGGATQGLDTKTAEHFIDFLMGHKVPYGMTYLRGLVQAGKILEAYKRAEPKLCVLQLPELNESHEKVT